MSGQYSRPGYNQEWVMMALIQQRNENVYEVPDDFTVRIYSEKEWQQIAEKRNGCTYYILLLCFQAKTVHENT